MANPDPLLGQLVDGRWRILDRLGAGGMGVVYRAERVKLFKLVALKFLDERCAQSPESVLRFEREARAISKLTHRHVVSILDFGMHGRRPYIVMEYLAGRPLNKELGRPTMTPKRGVNIVCQILEALRHAHRAGVVHRDLKPENVMLVETTGTEDYVKILDFGLARIISLDEPSISLPQRVAGTPGYMSPEQVRSDKVDHRSDLYSAGVILYALCVGKKPFIAADDLDVLRMHLNMPPPPPRKTAPNLSAALEKVILRALEKDRDRRFFSAEEMQKALLATPEGGGRKKSGWGTAAAIAVLLIAGVVAGVFVRPYLQTTEPTTAHTTEPATVHTNEPTTVHTTEPATVHTNEPITAHTTALTIEPTPSPAVVDAAVDAAIAPDLAERPPLTIEQKVEALFDAEQLADAERLLLAQAILEPKAGWVHLELGELYFRRIWRKDAVREWELALQLDPGLRRDARLSRRLCSTLASGWKGAGEHFIVARVGRDALYPMIECIQTTDDPERLRAAVRVMERTGLRGKIDRAVVAERLQSLAR